MNITICRGCDQLPYGMSGYCIQCPQDPEIHKILGNLSHAVARDDKRILVPLTDIAWCSHACDLKRVR
ncbi:MAG TPA: hypothetical protein O0X27_07085 [Methanocorpusculum sp.]|nr:hypothetical protein [Methanocorpusculum sp.]